MEWCNGGAAGIDQGGGDGTAFSPPSSPRGGSCIYLCKHRGAGTSLSISSPTFAVVWGCLKSTSTRVYSLRACIERTSSTTSTAVSLPQSPHMNQPAPPNVPIVPRSEPCQSDCRKHSLAMDRNGGLGILYTQMPRQVASSVLTIPISSCGPLSGPQEASWQPILPILRCIYLCTGAFTSANNANVWGVVCRSNRTSA